MKKIVTAINNPTLNEKLKKEDFIEVIGKDIQYKEAILELLEIKKEIDIIIIYEKIPGEINLLKLIETIKTINKKIKIIIILEKENNYLESKLKYLNINSIYLNNKINLEKLIKIIKEKEINREEELKKEIERLEKIIEKNKVNKIKNTINIKNFINKIDRKLEKSVYINNNMETKLITFWGYPGSGKTMTALILSEILAEEKNKILLIDMDMCHPSISYILNIEKNNNYINKKNKEKYNNKLKNKNNKKEKKKKIINKNKININLKEIKYKINKYKKIIKKNNKIKINKYLYLINNLENIFNNKKTNYNLFLEKIIEKNKYKFNYIIIDLGYKNNKEINKVILRKSDKIFIVTEANMLGIKDLEEILKICQKNYQIDSNNINIILNKFSRDSIDKEIIKKIFIQIKNFFKINYEKNYQKLINSNFKNKKILINKKIKNKFQKIINNLNK